MKNLILTFAFLIGLVVCGCGQKTENSEVTTINDSLQMVVTELLEQKMVEEGCDKGHVIIMDAKTGALLVKRTVTMTPGDSASVQYGDEFVRLESSVLRSAFFLAALETGKVSLDDCVDTGIGIAEFEGTEIKDWNWNRGGYRSISVSRILSYSSNIGMCHLAEKAFGSDTLNNWVSALQWVGYDRPISVIGTDECTNDLFVEQWQDEVPSMYYTCLGYNYTASSLQPLSFINTIANDGYFVNPRLAEGDVVKDSVMIASAENIKAMQDLLCQQVNDNLSTGYRAHSDKVSISGLQGIMQCPRSDQASADEDMTYNVEFAGYFPSENPKYSVYILMRKHGSATAGATVLPLARDIAECMAE